MRYSPFTLALALFLSFSSVTAFSQSNGETLVIDKRSANGKLKNLDRASKGAVKISKGNAERVISDDVAPAKDKSLVLAKNNACGASQNYDVSFSEDGEAFTLFFNEFYINAMDPSPYVSLTRDKRTNNAYGATVACHLVLNITLPHNWTFAINDFTVLGMANLTGDTSSSITINYGYPARFLPVAPGLDKVKKSARPGKVMPVDPKVDPKGRGNKKLYFSSGAIILQSPFEDSFMNTLSFDTYTFAPCSSQVELNLFNTIKVGSRSKQSLSDLNTYVGIDLVDSVFHSGTQGQARFGLKWINCDQVKGIGGKTPSESQAQ